MTGLPEFKRITDDSIHHLYSNRAVLGEGLVAIANAQKAYDRQQLADWVKEQTPEKVREGVEAILDSCYCAFCPHHGEECAADCSEKPTDQILYLLALQHEAEIEKARQEGREEVVKWVKEHYPFIGESPREGKGYQYLGCYILRWGKDDEPTMGFGRMSDTDEWQHQLSVWGITGQ